MRFYNIELTGLVAGPSATFTSHPNGQFDPGALNVVWRIPVFNAAAPMSNCQVTIHGVSLQTVGQARNFNGAQIAVSAGMAAGLPLATAAFNAGQQGLIAQGSIFQAYGNWVGTDMTLDMIFNPSGGATQSAPANLTFNWPKGTQLGAGIQSVLQNAYPKWTVNLNVNQGLTLTEAIPGVYQTLEQFAAFVNDYSKTLNPDPDYNGVDITFKPGNIFNVHDGTQNTGSPKQLLFQDLIGQPTWLGPGQISFYTVMRADISVGDMIMLPPALTTTTAAAAAPGVQQANQSSFSGAFLVQTAEHVGEYRDPNGESWVTSFQAIMPGAIMAANLPDAEG